MSKKNYTDIPYEPTKRTKGRKRKHKVRPAGLKTRSSISYSTITNIPVFDCASALCKT
jgi:hypothetical protein